MYSPSFKNVEHFLIKEETIVRYELSNIEKIAKNTQEPLNSQIKNYAQIKVELLKKEPI